MTHSFRFHLWLNWLGKCTCGSFSCKKAQFLECKFVGLNRYHYTFDSKAQMDAFFRANYGSVAMVELYTGCFYELEVTFPRITINFD